jgi:Cytosol aminopeptidase family, N-terminal domain
LAVGGRGGCPGRFWGRPGTPVVGVLGLLSSRAMELRFVAPDLRRLDGVQAEVVACGIWEDERPLTGLGGLLDWRLGGKLSQLARGGFLSGALGEVLFVPGRPRLPFDKVLLFGLGPRLGFGDDPFREAVRRLVDTLSGLQVRRAIVELPGRGDDAVTAERACELAIEHVAPREDHDAWILVEPTEAQKRVAQRAQDERRRSLSRPPRSIPPERG